MPIDPLSLAQMLVGGKQLGAAAPAYQSGMSSFQPMIGLLGQDQALAANQMINPFAQDYTAKSLEELIGRPETRGQELAPQVTANDQSSVMGPPESLPNPMGPPESRQGGFVDRSGIEMGPPPGFAGPEGFFGKLGQGFEGFFGNLDQNLQSPSKVIGLGLLNRIDPRLAGAGLLAGGLLGNRKVF